MHDALSAEGEAYLEALKAAMEEGISRVAIETDSANLVAAVMTNSFDVHDETNLLSIVMSW